VSAKIRPLAQITREAETILIREMGIADALRFLSQYRTAQAITRRSDRSGLTISR
jgi:hypothetical protein